MDHSGRVSRRLWTPIEGPAPSPERVVDSIADVLERIRAWEVSQIEAEEAIDLVLRDYPVPTRITYFNMIRAYHDHLGLIVKGMRLAGYGR